MSAIPQSEVFIQPAPAGATWLTLKLAAQKMGLCEGQVRRRCFQEWERQRLAERRAPATGRGKPVWWIRSDADPRLSSVRTAEQYDDGFDDQVLTKPQRDLLNKRLDAVQRWHALLQATERGALTAAKTALLDQLATEGLVLRSERTLELWYNAWKARGRLGLCKGDWKLTPDGGKIADPFADFYRALEGWYLDLNQPALAAAYRVAVAEARKAGWSIPSLRTAQRWADAMHLARKVKGRKGAKAFDDAVASYVQRDYTRIVVDGVERPMESNDIWCADHHPCDAIVAWKDKLVRPWLTAWEDLRSRRIVGYVFAPQPPDSSAVLLALRHAALNTGLCVPLFAYTDNGKDFDCYTLTGQTKAERRKAAMGPAAGKWATVQVQVKHDLELFRGAYGSIQVRVMRAIPYNAKAKPVERFFRTFEDQFGRFQHTYCGNKPENKPEHLQPRLDKGEAPTFEAYAAAATAWIEEIYHTSPHSGHGMDDQAPGQVYAANLLTKRMTSEASLDACLSMTRKPVKVGRNGVEWDGRLYGQGDPALLLHAGKPVRLFADPSDVSRVVVRDLEGRRLCEALCNALVPFGVVGNDEMRRAISATQSHNRALKQVARRGMRIIKDPVEVLREDRAAELAKARRDNPGEPPPTPTLKPIHTPFDEPSKDRGQPMRLRPAVGAEGLDLLAAADSLEGAPALRLAGAGEDFDLLSAVDDGGEP